MELDVLPGKVRIQVRAQRCRLPAAYLHSGQQQLVAPQIQIHRIGAQSASCGEPIVRQRKIECDRRVWLAFGNQTLRKKISSSETGSRNFAVTATQHLLQCG